MANFTQLKWFGKNTVCGPVWQKITGKYKCLINNLYLHFFASYNNLYKPPYKYWRFLVHIMSTEKVQTSKMWSKFDSPFLSDRVTYLCSKDLNRTYLLSSACFYVYSHWYIDTFIILYQIHYHTNSWFLFQWRQRGWKEDGYCLWALAVFTLIFYLQSQ